MKDRSELWSSTYSGGKFHIFDPRVSEVKLIDIAQALSMTCRFGGMIDHFYSVAQHSLVVYDAVRTHLVKLGGGDICQDGFDILKKALLHDAAEAYTGDIVRPYKIGIPETSEVEKRILEKIFEKFGLSKDIPFAVEIADDRALGTEARVLFLEPPDWCYNYGPHFSERTKVGSTFIEVRNEFMRAAKGLGLED